MRATDTVAFLALAFSLLPISGRAAGLKAIRPIPGYVCMLLSPADEQVTDQSKLPPILAAPSVTSQRLGFPSGVVFVKSPLHEVGGFAEMLRLNGQTGWIDAHHLRPWHPMNNNGDTCVPSIMSNGRLGIG